MTFRNRCIVPVEGPSSSGKDIVRSRRLDRAVSPATIEEIDASVEFNFGAATSYDTPVARNEFPLTMMSRSLRADEAGDRDRPSGSSFARSRQGPLYRQ